MAYAASKGATNTLTMSLARILAPKIRVNAVCPALVADGFLQRQDPTLFADRAARQIARAPLQKVALPIEVAADVYWLTTVVPCPEGEGYSAALLRQSQRMTFRSTVSITQVRQCANSFFSIRSLLKNALN
eukprot:gene21201-29118_t